MRELQENEAAIIENSGYVKSLKAGQLVEYTLYFKVTEVTDDGVIGEVLTKIEWHKIVNSGHGPVVAMWRGHP